jgi:predicted phage terminase large subunit-like protein
MRTSKALSELLPRLQDLPPLELLLAERERRAKQREAFGVQTKEDEEIQQIKDACEGEGGLINFVRLFWHVLEPETELIEGWPLEAICDHLEAVTFGKITRLLINVPPGFMKSLLVDVFWPAWEWGPMDMSFLRYVAFSYSDKLTKRDNEKFRDLIQSWEYQRVWGSLFKLTKFGERKISNNKTGSKTASSVGGVSTGERGDRVILDDPHNVKTQESKIVREETVRWFREGMSNRLNNMRDSAIIIIMQRVHEGDISGSILEDELPYVHLCIPMEYDWTRQVNQETGEPIETEIGWYDPRFVEDDPDACDRQLAWPERFSYEDCEALKSTLLEYAWSGQYQQAPRPRGGGLFKDEYWQLWDDPKGQFPTFEYLVGSLDTAATEKEQNHPSGFTLWGVFLLPRPGATPVRRVMLVRAWRKWLKVGDDEFPPRRPDETDRAYRERCKPHWGLVSWLAESCRFRNAQGKVIGTVDRILIEGKSTGITVGQEIQRLHGREPWQVIVTTPRGEKYARGQAVHPSFSQGLIYAPAPPPTATYSAPFVDWAYLVIQEMGAFPKGKYDDLTDSATQAIKHLRDIGLLQNSDEQWADEQELMKPPQKLRPLYPV